ncbi:MAG: hypothetical protein V1886_04130 [archaeon]
MNFLRQFKDYVNEGIIKRCSPDKSRANFLINEAKLSFAGLKERIEKLGVKDCYANSLIKDSYDIVMELIRAKLLSEGYNSSGSYSHEAEVSYMRVLGFTENEVLFMNELRYFRNGITYYGRILDKEYAEKVIKFLDKAYPKFAKMLGMR